MNFEINVARGNPFILGGIFLSQKVKMVDTVKIASSGNVVIPAYLSLKSKGYMVRCEKTKSGDDLWYLFDSK